MSNKFASLVEVLTVEKQEGKVRADGTKPVWSVARCVVFGQDFRDVVTVGRLRIPKALEETVKPGKFTASFSLGVPDWGDNKGDIIAQLVGLVPAPPVASAAASTPKVA